MWTEPVLQEKEKILCSSLLKMDLIKISGDVLILDLTDCQKISLGLLL